MGFEGELYIVVGVGYFFGYDLLGDISGRISLFFIIRVILCVFFFRRVLVLGMMLLGCLCRGIDRFV